jgi:ABC-type glycerol-3-phosphate transport system substrate-binding protein
MVGSIVDMNVKQTTRRSVLWGLPALPAALPVLAACAAPPGTSQPTTAKIAPGKVVVMSYQNTSPKLDMQQALYEELKKEFTPKGIEVDFITTAATSNDQKMAQITTMHVAGTPPDMWEWPWLWRSFEGMLAELSAFMARDKIDEKQWIPEAIGSMKQGTKVWGVPVSISADAMAYNLELFEAAGLKPPPVDPDDRSWTMEAFLDTAKKLTKGTEQFGFGGSITGGIDWANAPTYFGYGPVDLAAKKVTIDTAGFKSGLQFFVDLLLRHHVQPSNEELNAIRATPGQAAFLTGKVAMERISSLADPPRFRWGIAALPYTPNPAQPKNVSGRISVHGLFMDSDSKAKDQAWEIFKYWMRPDTNQRYVVSDGHAVSPLVKTGSEISLQDFQKNMGANAKAFFLQGQRSKVDAWGFYLLKDWSKAQAEAAPLFVDTRAGKISVAEFATKVQAATERLAQF